MLSDRWAAQHNKGVGNERHGPSFPQRIIEHVLLTFPWVEFTAGEPPCSVNQCINFEFPEPGRLVGTSRHQPATIRADIQAARKKK